MVDPSNHNSFLLVATGAVVRDFVLVVRTSPLVLKIAGLTIANNYNVYMSATIVHYTCRENHFCSYPTKVKEINTPF